MVGRTAVNQTLAGLAGSLAALYSAALSQPALALAAAPQALPDAVASIWSLVGGLLREAVKPPPVVRRLSWPPHRSHADQATS